MASSLEFSVKKREPVLVVPAEPTPNEFKLLSEIDNHDSVRIQIPLIQFYSNNLAIGGKDPAQVVRDALAKALVYYYPFAGRVREWPGRKLVVECTGEGVLFIEADADVSLEQFSDFLHPPFPRIDELIYNIPGSEGILNTPLLLVQVTRLSCGGFIFGMRCNHTMSDAIGFSQFVTAIGEIARGALTPSILPVWQRELLQAQVQPPLPCEHREYEEVTETKGTIPSVNDIVQHSFFFGPKEVLALRKHMPPHLHGCSRFDLVTACLLRCRSMALCFGPDEEVRLFIAVNIRSKYQPQLPDGYYGNAIGLSQVVATVGELGRNPLSYAVELVRKAKARVNDADLRSIDWTAIIGQSPMQIVRTFTVSDLTHANFDKVDFGWGKPVYGGPAKGDMGPVPGFSVFYIPFTSKKGENGLLVPLCLPGPAMEMFSAELEIMTSNPME